MREELGLRFRESTLSARALCVIVMYERKLRISYQINSNFIFHFFRSSSSIFEVDEQLIKTTKKTKKVRILLIKGKTTS